MTSSKKMETRRILLVTMYFDICDAYNLYAFLPHCAMAIWDKAQSDTLRENTAVDAACFAVAQKMADTSIFTITDLSEVFSASEEDIRTTEKELLATSLILPDLRPDRHLIKRLSSIDATLHDHMKRFFNLSLFGKRVR